MVRFIGFVAAFAVISAASAQSVYVVPADYGAVCDGVTDDWVPLQNMISANAGKIIFLPAGVCVTNTTLVMPANTTITGGGEISILTGNALPLLAAVDKTEITLSNFWLKGTRNVTSWSASAVGAMTLQQTTAATGDQTYTITGMKFSNFNTSYWVHVSSSTGNFYNVKNFTFSNNLWVTDAGDIPNDPDPLNNNNYGLYVLSSSAGHGRIDSPVIKNNRFESTGMCFPITVMGNSYKMQITENLITDAGITNARVNGHCLSGDGNTDLSYGINIYDPWGDGNPPTKFLVSSNTIINPYGTGLYVVGDGYTGHTAAVYNSSGSLISNNLIDGQVSQTDTTLPRAGIVVALTTDVDVVGNKISNSFGGIAAVGQSSGLINIIGNSCKTAVGSAGSIPFCYKIEGGPSGDVRRILRGNYGESLNTTAGRVIAISSGSPLHDVEIMDNSIAGAYQGLYGPNLSVSGLLTISGNKFNGRFNGSMIDLTALPALSSFFTGNQFWNDVTGVSGISVSSLPAAFNGSQVYLSNGASGSSPCAGGGTGATAFRQNGTWKCF